MVRLVRIGIEEAEKLWKMQAEAFMGFYEKYQDAETSPATEPLGKMEWRLSQPHIYYYYIMRDETIVGAFRVIDRKELGIPKKLSSIFIMPEYRNQGLAQKAIRLAEEIHGERNWVLDTILQEKGNCHLYEKMGYYQTGETKIVNDKLTLVSYQKG